jgi:hypothetical protein
VVAKLGGFTAGQVTGVEADRIDRHLAGCPSCRALHAELLDVCAGLRRYAGALPPAALAGHAAIGKVGLIGHIAATSARLKLAVAAVSAVAVGGVGVAAGPVISHFDPSSPTNRGVAVGPALLSTVPVTGARHAFGPTRGRIAGEFAPVDHPATHIPAGRPTYPNVPATHGRATTGAARATTSPAGADTTSAAPRLQRAGVTPTGDTPVDVAPMATAQPPVTEWSTSWTSAGTTVWLWGWSGRP